MNDVNELVEELRMLIVAPEISPQERFKLAVNRIADFLAGVFGVEKSEVAVLWRRGDALSFIWPEFLSAAKDLDIASQRPVAANILRSGASFLDNRLQEHEHMVEYEFVKEDDGEARRIWKMMGVAVTVNAERLGVIQISRKRRAFGEPGPDFTPGDLEYLEKLAARLGPGIKAIVPF